MLPDTVCAIGTLYWAYSSCQHVWLIQQVIIITLTPTNSLASSFQMSSNSCFKPASPPTDTIDQMLMKNIKANLTTLANIEQLNRKTVERFVNMTKLLANSDRRLKRSRLSSDSEESTRLIEKEIYKEVSYLYSVRQTDDVVPTVFKQKPVSLRFRVVDSEGKPVQLAEPTVFTLELWLASMPTARLEKSHKGASLLSGCTEVSSYGEVEFRKFYVSEVSSHYSNNNFFLVVRPMDAAIRPYVMKNFTVRARKPTQKEILKRLRQT
mmetsp:Transcript_3626/g.7799  ORF Transcript_3626/g.7799 Transcript_3626/m.7799 type:complete len:266 (+) Transcript_3626:489-1286(+)